MARHIQQAERNEDLYEYLGRATPPYYEWQVVALFYSALHYVDAYLATLSLPNGVHPGSHSERNYLVRVEAFLRGLWVDYRELQDRSRDARYDLVSFRPTDVRDLRLTAHARIQGQVRRKLRLPAR
jgi:hypothetical protein